MNTDNELIADFMGYEVLDKYPRHNIVAPESGGRKFYLRNKMKYQTSWDWLMPVVEKIESLRHYVLIDTGSCEIGGDDVPVSISYENGDTKIKMVYLAVIEFINWHNENKIDSVNN